MRSYLDLLRLTLDTGRPVPTRARLASTGQHVGAREVFAPPPLRVDLRAGFPAVTTKRLAWRAVVGELLWFLSGSTNVRDLQALGVTIWDEWAREDGDLGPVYGAQWRGFHGRDGRAVDQIDRLTSALFSVAHDPAHPARRRLLLTGYNPADVDAVALPPCHVLAQWHLDPDPLTLSCHLYQRSADVFLGVPFNVASYALLTHLFAARIGAGVGDLTVSYGNLHLYDNHEAQACEQLRREPLPLPRLAMPEVTGDSGNPYGFRVKRAGVWVPPVPDDFRLDGYLHHPGLPGEVAV